VAKLAGLPEPVISRAQEVLARLERAEPTAASRTSRADGDTAQAALPRPHPLIDEVRQIDLFSMTPLDALNRLAELQKRAEEASSL
jgi:DNA mismatch repair protein MutS